MVTVRIDCYCLVILENADKEKEEEKRPESRIQKIKVSYIVN